MIGYLKGKVVQKLPQALIIEVMGVGYEVFCPVQTLEMFGQVGSEAELYVASQTRTDGTFLYGFQTPVEKLLFLKLIKADSVGPKMALTVLSAAPYDELARLIDAGETSALSKLPKVGKKTAENLVVKLKGKLEDLISEFNLIGDGPDIASRPQGAMAGRKIPRGVRGEAVTTLVHLGFRQNDVERTLEAVSEKVWDAGLEEVIREALRSIQG